MNHWMNFCLDGIFIDSNLPESLKSFYPHYARHPIQITLRDGVKYLVWEEDGDDELIFTTVEGPDLEADIHTVALAAAIYYLNFDPISCPDKYNKEIADAKNWLIGNGYTL